MIDWLDKLPDWSTGAIVAGGLWLGFNYAVLADRTIERERAANVMPRCMARLAEHEASQQVRPLGIGTLFGMPQLNELERDFLKRHMPAPLSPAQKGERCACAAKHAMQKLKLDFAIHLATFRIFSPHGIGAISENVTETVFGNLCGPIPRLVMPA